jgi:FkbH-like protein
LPSDSHKSIKVYVLRNENWEPYFGSFSEAAKLFGLNPKLVFSGLGVGPRGQVAPECDYQIIWFNPSKLNADSIDRFYQDLMNGQSIRSGVKTLFIAPDRRHLQRIRDNSPSLVANHLWTIIALQDVEPARTNSSLIGADNYDKFAIKQGVARILQFIIGHEIEIPRLIFLDLDNTLINGVIGEIDTDWTINEEYKILNEFLLGLKDNGVMLVLVTKNNLADVHNFFKHNPSIGIGLDAFVTVAADWGEKSDHIKQIIEEFNLYPEVCLFIDDNITELIRVNNVIPKLPVVLATSPTLVQRILQIFLSRIKGESMVGLSRIREQDLIARRKRLTFFKHSEALISTESDSILLALETRISPAAVDIATVDRVNELFRKTNQFNVSLHRSHIGLPLGFGDRAFLCAVKDIYSDSGIVSAILINKDNLIREFVISCRVLGRGLEAYLLRSMLDLDFDNNSSRKYQLLISQGERNMPALTFAKSILSTLQPQNELDANSLCDRKVLTKLIASSSV